MAVRACSAVCRSAWSSAQLLPPIFIGRKPGARTCSARRFTLYPRPRLQRCAQHILLNWRRLLSFRKKLNVLAYVLQRACEGNLIRFERRQSGCRICTTQHPSKELKANSAAQQAAIIKAEVAERAAGREVRAKFTALEGAFKHTVAGLQAAVGKATDSEQVASDASTKMAAMTEIMDALEAAAEDLFGARARDADYQLGLATKRENGGKDALLLREEQSNIKAHGPISRTEEEWSASGPDAERKARSCEVHFSTEFLELRTFRACDLCTALHMTGYLDAIWGQRELNKIYSEELRCVMAELEREHFGERFGLHLHYEVHLTLAKIVEIAQAAGKTYDPVLNAHQPKKLHIDKHCPSNFINFPRLAPPRSRLEPLIKAASEALGLQVAENGRISFLPLQDVVGELLSHDPGKQAMPLLSDLVDLHVPVPTVTSWDATGFGKLKLRAIVVNNPCTSQSAQNLRVFGPGMVDDNKDGTTRLLQDDNLVFLNRLLRSFNVRIRPSIVCDLASFRHCEHLNNSGFCGCSREALRTIRKAPEDEAELTAFLDSKCISLAFEQRCSLGHNCVPGESYPQGPCVAPGCTFMHGHSPAAASMAAYALFLEEKAALLQDTDKPGQRRYQKWRMEHAHIYFNVQSGQHGMPLMHCHTDDMILDYLHRTDINLCYPALKRLCFLIARTPLGRSTGITSSPSSTRSAAAQRTKDVVLRRRNGTARPWCRSARARADALVARKSLPTNPSALRTGWKPLTASSKQKAEKPPQAARRSGRSAGRGGRGSGKRGRGAFVDAFGGFGSADAPEGQQPPYYHRRCRQHSKNDRLIVS
eukprot:4707961-Pleurochrysis_carterae.AAC.2